MVPATVESLRRGRSSLPDDDYWAAKIIAALKPEHLDALFEAAKHPDEKYTADILDTLKKRREKTLRYAFGQVSPLEVSNLEGGKLILKDIGAEEAGLASSEYRVSFLNSRGRKIAAGVTVQGGNEIEIPISQALQASKGYLRVDVTAVRDGHAAPRAAQFHIRQSGDAPSLAGVVH